MVKNDEGLVAVRHWNSNGASAVVGKVQYSFVPQYGVSLGWVQEEHVAYLLTIKVNGCCGMDKQKFALAHQNAVSVWERGHL